MTCLEHLDGQMRQASDSGLFLNEARMVKIVYDTMKFDDSLRLESPLNSVAQATHALHAEAVKMRQHHSAKNQSKLDIMKNALKPYVFEHVPNCSEMTVKIAVPRETVARDVLCRFSRDALQVSVKGHALQPTVINGKLQHPVDVESCAWRLEGNGEYRQLVIDLEKISGGLDWQDLLQFGSVESEHVV
ncbi:hypothetical protein AB1Y20_015754 [Prymnesium parvum]|uniref:CS domain-containing protein n=1 Tax=Prymnesium parvum TaxID=97485 RepID=A0AB34K2D4_PRYPA